MPRKLTLYLDDGVIEKAKLMSKKKNASLSGIVESFLREKIKKDYSSDWASKWLGVGNADKIVSQRRADRRIQHIMHKHVK